MPVALQNHAPSLATFTKSLKTNSIEGSIELLISLLKRRQIRHSRQCALATIQLLIRVVAADRTRDASKLIDRIREVGRRLVAAQPREMAVGNIVRRVLGVVREVAEQVSASEEGSEGSSAPMSPAPGEAKRPALPTNFSSFNPLSHPSAVPQDLHPRPRTPGDGASPAPMDGSTEGHSIRRPMLPTSTSYAGANPPSTSLLSFLDTPLIGRSSGGNSPFSNSPRGPSSLSTSQELPPKGSTIGAAITTSLDIKAEVIDGIKEILDELTNVDSQIAESALDHIHANDTILTYTSSQTVQRFLAAAARKRKFTVIHAECYPNDHVATHATILNGNPTSPDGDDEAEERWKPLTSMGITVILIPDTAIYALMPRISKVIISPHAVMANGSLLAAAGTSTLCLAANAHRVPVVVLSGVYKLSPVYPFDTDELIEYGDPGKVVGFEEGEFVGGSVEVVNPVMDFVDSETVDLFVMDTGGCAPSFLYRVVGDHYDGRDGDLGGK